ncbi:MAG: TPM domain-containing protein [Eubacteriales bacterium]|nr:TPM domain-containing protein [Eubacteriales bacterium]
MKKKRIILSIVFLFVFSFILSLQAFAYSGPPLVYDEPGLLSSSEKSELTRMAEELSDRYSCTVAAIFVKSLNSYRQIQDFADDFYDSNGYGYGSSHDGIMLVVSMTERKTHLTTTGKAIDIFTDYGLEKVEKSFLTKLSAGDYANAVKSFLSSCEGLLKQYSETGVPYDIHSGSGSYQQNKGFSLAGIIGSLCGGFALGGAPLRKQKKEMTTVQAKANASDYKTGSLRLSVRNDRFITKNVTRVPRPRDNDRGSGGFSGGGSSIHVSSSGFSHGGRSGSF